MSSQRRRPCAALILKIMAHIKLISHEGVSEHKATYGRKAIGSILALNGFAAGSISSGYFEGCMNIWTMARKE